MGQLSHQTQVLVQWLRDCYESDTIATYKDLSEILNENVRGKLRSSLSRAIEYTRREYGYVFRNLVNIGYKPIKNTEKVSRIQNVRESKVQSQVNKWDSEWSTIDTLKLEQEAMPSYLEGSTKLFLYKQIYGERCKKAIKESVHSPHPQADVSHAKNAIKALIDVS